MTHPIGTPMPSGERLYGFAASLARPVARGHLPLGHADASLITHTLRAERDGTLGPYQAAHVVKGLLHTLRLRLEAERVQRDLAAHRIRRLLRPLIALHKPWATLMAEAHGDNGEAGFPLAEAEVSDIVATEVFFALPRRVRHGR